jgi:hypothetical protein
LSIKEEQVQSLGDKDKRGYTSSNHMSKGRFDKEALKKKYL